jgi:transposase-like protein
MQPKMQRMQRTSYTPEQKAAALALLAQVGKAEAARRTGIPAGTIAAWGSRTGVSAPTPEALRPVVEARQLAWAERKVALASKLGDAADLAVAELTARIQTKTIGDRELITALTALVDRAQLLTGEATSRPEVLGGEPAPRAKLVSIVGALAERAAS